MFLFLEVCLRLFVKQATKCTIKHLYFPVKAIQLQEMQYQLPHILCALEGSGQPAVSQVA